MALHAVRLPGRHLHPRVGSTSCTRVRNRYDVGSDSQNIGIHQLLRGSSSNAAQVLVLLQLLDRHDCSDDCAFDGELHPVRLAHQPTGSIGADVQFSHRAHSAATGAESGIDDIRVVDMTSDVFGLVMMMNGTWI